MQADLLAGLNVVAVIPHAVDLNALRFRERPDDYLIFLGRFSEGEGVLQAIDAARQAGFRLLMAAAENESGPSRRGGAARRPGPRRLRRRSRTCREKAALWEAPVRCCCTPYRKANRSGSSWPRPWRCRYSSRRARSWRRAGSGGRGNHGRSVRVTRRPREGSARRSSHSTAPASGRAPSSDSARTEW